MVSTESSIQQISVACESINRIHVNSQDDPVLGFIQGSPLDLLPDELLLKILGYVPLPDLALLLWRPQRNRRLRRICQDTTLCRSITVDTVWDKKTARAVMSMARQRLEELTIAVKKKTKRKNGCYFKMVETNWDDRWLQQDNLRDRVASDAVLSTLLSVAVEYGNKITLRKLNLRTSMNSHGWPHCCPLSSTLLANASASSLRGLVSIDMQNAKFVTGRWAWVKAIADNCMHLEHVALPNLFGLTDQAFQYFLERVQGRLKHLSANCCRLNDDSYGALKHCQQLEVLMVREAWHIRQEGIKTILELPKLQKLYISAANELTGPDFVQSLRGKLMGEMRCLELEAMVTSLDDKTLGMISIACPNLLGLFLYTGSCQGLCQVGVNNVMKRCKKLAIFYLRHVVGWTPSSIDGFYCRYIGTSEQKTYYYRRKEISREAVKNVTPLFCHEDNAVQLRKYFADSNP